MIIFKGNLTKHFSASEYAVGCGDANVYLTEDAYIFAQALEETRSAVGLKFYVNSWYRTTKLNKAVGGISSSNHLRGCACDFHLTQKITRKRFIKIVTEFKTACKKRGVIPEAGLYNDFIHLGIQNPTQAVVNGNKFSQWDERTGTSVFNNIIELQD